MLEYLDTLRVKTVSNASVVSRLYNGAQEWDSMTRHRIVTQLHGLAELNPVLMSQ